MKTSLSINPKQISYYFVCIYHGSILEQVTTKNGQSNQRPDRHRLPQSQNPPRVMPRPQTRINHQRIKVISGKIEKSFSKQG